MNVWELTANQIRVRFFKMKKSRQNYSKSSLNASSLHPGVTLFLKIFDGDDRWVGSCRCCVCCLLSMPRTRSRSRVEADACSNNSECASADNATTTTTVTRLPAEKRPRIVRSGDATATVSSANPSDEEVSFSIGDEFRKRFAGVWYVGKVDAKLDMEDDDTEQLWHVVYTDGDSEDLSTTCLNGLIQCYNEYIFDNATADSANESDVSETEDPDYDYSKVHKINLKYDDNEARTYTPMPLPEYERHDIKFNLHSDSPEACAFELSHIYIKDDLIANLVRGTNRYACNRLPASKVRTVTAPDILYFLAFLYYMGLVRLPC